MKTHKANLIKNLKAITFAIILFTISLVGSTQDSCLLIFDKDMNLRLSDNVYAMVDVSRIEEIYINPDANLYYIEFEGVDEDLNIERWMSSEKFVSTGASFEWENEECEENLEIEEWMYKENTITENEPDLEIEKWMSDSWTN